MLLPPLIVRSPAVPLMLAVPLLTRFEPRKRLLAVSLLVTCAVPPLLMIALLNALGAPDGVQLAPLAQSPVAVFQVLFCPCALSA